MRGTGTKARFEPYLRFLKHPLRARARDAAKRALNLCFKMNRMRLGSPKPFTTSGLILGKTDKRAIFHRNFRVHLGSSRAESRHWPCVARSAKIPLAG